MVTADTTGASQQLTTIARFLNVRSAYGATLSPEFTALLLGLVIYTGAFIAEIVRTGIRSVGKGQLEAARAIGLIARTGTPSPLRAQSRQAARQQRDLAVRASSGRAR